MDEFLFLQYIYVYIYNLVDIILVSLIYFSLKSLFFNYKTYIV